MSLLAAVLLASAAQAAPTRIGAAGAVSGGVSAAAPEAARRALKSGSEVFHKDAVSTDEEGRLQVLLLDETVFTVGPRSEVLLDEFVYDPFADAGKLTAQVTKGVFRLVTGNVARKRADRVSIKTPSGTIGIRGTIAGGRVEEDGSALVALLGPGRDNDADERPGALVVASEQGSVSLEEPGTATRLAPGEPPSPPFTLSPGDLASLEAGAGPAPAAPAAAAEEEEAGEAEESATEAAGEDDAGALETAFFADETGEAADATEDASAFAAQDALEGAGIRDGLALWDDVRTIESGQAHYSGSGPWDLVVCNGGSCANNQSGSFSFAMNIDFGARTVGGGGSGASGSDSDSNAFGGSPVSASVAIPQASFASETGDAVVAASNGSATAVVELLNAGGQAASHALGTLIYDDGSNKASGDALGDRFDGLIPQ